MVFTAISRNLIFVVAILAIWETKADRSNAHMSKPNRQTGLERILGLGVVAPYPYFQKPAYRFPVYDRHGRGRLLYGYGGQETFRYRYFTPIDGHH